LISSFIGSQKLLEAVRLAEQAVARDPQFVSAFCLLGRLHTSLFYGGYDPTPARRESAEAALQNARRLQPESGEVHLAWAYYSYYAFLDYDRARAELELARRTLPNSAELYYLTALLDRRQARWTEATRNAERAVELDPRNTAYLMLTGGLYEQQHSYSDGRRLFNRALAIEPHNLVARILCARAPFYQIADLRPLRAELSATLPKNQETRRRWRRICYVARWPTGTQRRPLVHCPQSRPPEWAALIPRWFIPANGSPAWLPAPSTTQQRRAPHSQPRAQRQKGLCSPSPKTRKVGACWQGSTPLSGARKMRCARAGALVN
jgi:tetratricopeptide (TPR) repeat protein